MSRAASNLIVIAAIAATVGTVFSLPVAAGDREIERGVSAELVIMSPPEVTLEALRASRQEDPEGIRIISSNANECVIEEQFDGLPIIGKTSCVYRETYDPQHVTYKMISSDKLKAFEGEWTISPTNDGQHSLVKLRSYIDTGLKIPFARRITDMASANEVKHHLSELKRSAEERVKRVLAKSKNQST